MLGYILWFDISLLLLSSRGRLPELVGGKATKDSLSRSLSTGLLIL